MQFKTSGKETNPTILLLHGFLGSSNDFTELVKNLEDSYHIIIPEIKEPCQKTITSEILNKIKDKTDVIMFGYSMGARIALDTYLKAPQKFSKLIFESLNPGIDDKKLREERKDNDLKLANKILSEGKEVFLSDWYSLSLFAFSDIEKIVAINTALHNFNVNTHLFLENLSVGAMQSMWKELKDITCETLLITGKNDAKFTSIANQIKNENTKIKHQVIDFAGHNTHFQKPEKFLKCLHDFLDL